MYPHQIVILVVLTIRVVVTFIKFMPLQPEQFFTPLSSSLLERKKERERRAPQTKEKGNIQQGLVMAHVGHLN
jgi:hypothetical protein